MRILSSWRGPKKGPEGWIDAIADGCISGWAWDPVDPEKVVEVRIVIDGEVAGTSIADNYRNDLEEAGIADGVHGFIFELPAEYFDRCQHEVTAFVDLGSADAEEEAIELNGSPTSFIAQSGDADPGLRVPGNFLVNGELADWKGRIRGTIDDNEFSPSTGWTIALSDDAAAQVDYSLVELDVADFEIPERKRPVFGLHLKSRKKIGHVRAFAELLDVSTRILGPYILCFYARAGGSAESAAIKEIAIGAKNGLAVNGRPRKIAHNLSVPGGGQHFLFDLPESIVSRSLYDDEKHYLIFEFDGDIDIELGAVRLQSLNSFLDPAARSGGFEDDYIEAQAPEIDGFFDNRAAAAASAGQADEPKWRYPEYAGTVEIVVPVFNAGDKTLDCLRSIERHSRIPHLVTIIDDGSSTHTAGQLRAYQQGKPWIRLVHNRKNLGYTRSINMAARDSSADVIVFLNSDTIVTEGWLDGLLNCLNASEATAVAGPLSNAASWQSLPEVRDKEGKWLDNPLPDGFDIDSMASLVSDNSPRLYPQVPIVNGFCFAVERRLFDDIGYFDDQTFPRGYGEENDFCLRAAKAGYEIRVADDTYVFHHKSSSFGSEQRSALTREANTALSEKHGERLELAARELEENSDLKAVRDRIKALLPGKARPGRGNGKDAADKTAGG